MARVSPEPAARRLPIGGCERSPNTVRTARPRHCRKADPGAAILPLGRAIAPVIETGRLRLRPPLPADLPAFAAMARDPEMFRYSQRGAMTREEAWAMLLRHIGYWSVRGFGLFAVEDKATGRFAAQVGASDFRRSLGPDFDGWPEFTWSVAAPFRGLGYATEAADAALRWLHERAAPERSVCLIHEANAPSLRVAAKLGYRELRRRRYRGYPAILFAREAVAARPA